MYKIFTLSLLLTLIIFSSCSYEELAAYDENVIRAAIEDGTVGALEISEDQISATDPRGAYYLACRLFDNGEYRISSMLARHAWYEGSGFIREQAALLTLKADTDAENWKDALFYSSIASGEFPESYEIRRQAAETLYWSRSDSEVEAAVESLAGFSEYCSDEELKLFQAVTAYRLAAPGWSNKWVSLFMEVSDSSLILRAWDYLLQKEESPLEYFPGMEALFSGRYLYAKGEYREALVRLEQAFYENPRIPFASGSLNALDKELESCYIMNGRAVSGRLVFRDAAQSLAGSDPDKSREYYFTAARLSRRAGYYSDALSFLSSSAEEGSLFKDPRRLWYYMDLKIRQNPASAAAEISEYIAEWDEPDYYSDVLERLVTALTTARSWQLLQDLAKILELSGPAEIYDRCRYISERAADMGWIEPCVFSTKYSSSYYSLLGTGNLPEIPKDTDPSPLLYSDAEAFIIGYIEFRLYSRAAAVVRKYRNILSEKLFIYVADSFCEAGLYLESIRLMYQYPGELTVEGLKRLYPEAYSREIRTAAEQQAIPVEVLSGLVWKESGFDSDIVSRSGAIGLCQLMPSTAEEMAWRTGVYDYDLYNPEDNLFFGSWYFNWLIGYVGNIPAAVISYNGGPGRVKGWEKNLYGLPYDLLFEAVPVLETHDYGKRVLTASAVYGMLYFENTPLAVREMFFPFLTATADDTE